MHDASCSLRFGNNGLAHAGERFRRYVFRVQPEQTPLSVGVLMCRLSVRRLSEHHVQGNPESKCSEGTSNVGGEFQSHLLLLLRFEFRLHRFPELFQTLRKFSH